MATYYVDNTLHSAANAMGTVAAAGSDYLLLQDVGTQQDGAFDGYGVFIASGTGVGQHRRIVSYVHSGHAHGERCAIVDAAWTTVPAIDATYEIAVGCDRNSGVSAGSGATGALRTIDRAMDAIADAGTGPHQIYVKGGRAYRETATIDTPGQSRYPVTVEGYAAAPGDGGVATIDGGGVLVSGITTGLSGSICYAFRNLRLANFTGNAFSLGGVTAMRFVRCSADNSGACGFSLAQDAMLVSCSASDNGNSGFYCSPSAAVPGVTFIDCHARGNGGQQFQGGSFVLLFCSASGLPSNKSAISAFNAPDGAVLVNCTVDGTGSSHATGFLVGSGNRCLAVNTIFSNLHRGVYAAVSDPLRVACRNLFVNCEGGNYVNYASEGDDVLADPAYVNESGGDLGLLVGSPAIGAGLPAHVDIGAAQHNSRNRIGGPCQIGVQA